MGLISSTQMTSLPVLGDEAIMAPKGHGSTEKPVMSNLRQGMISIIFEPITNRLIFARWGCDKETADRICCFNRHYAEHSGYWTSTEFTNYVRNSACLNSLVCFYFSFYEVG